MKTVKLTLGVFTDPGGPNEDLGPEISVDVEMDEPDPVVAAAMAAWNTALYFAKYAAPGTEMRVNYAEVSG
jgi:hypothetical protein